MDDDGRPVISEGQTADGLAGAPDRARPGSPDRVLSAVGDEDRRVVLDALLEASDEALPFDALVDRVADRLDDEHAEAGAPDPRQRVRIALHHRHLPKLAAAGLVDHADADPVEFAGGELSRDLLALVGSYAAAE